MNLNEDAVSDFLLLWYLFDLVFSSQDFELDFFIDIHAHSTMMNGFMYGNVYEDTARFEKHGIFPRLFSRNAEDFSINNTTFNRDAFKAGTGRR